MQLSCVRAPSTPTRAETATGATADVDNLPIDVETASAPALCQGNAVKQLRYAQALAPAATAKRSATRRGARGMRSGAIRRESRAVTFAVSIAPLVADEEGLETCGLQTR